MERLRQYEQLLATTGVQWGLIGPRETERLWERHIDNCLAVTEDPECLPANATVIDVGSGAGLPGMVWAIARPDLEVLMVEPLQRRVTFLCEAIDNLGLTNARVQRGRAQDVRQTADRVTARAVSRTSNLVKWMAPLTSPDGSMVLLKGQRAADEVEQAKPWLDKHHWQASIREVGDPPRTRVVIVERTGQG